MPRKKRVQFFQYNLIWEYLITALIRSKTIFIIAVKRRGVKHLLYYTKCYRMRSARTTRRCSFDVRSALIFGANKIYHPLIIRENLPPSPSPLVSHLPLFTFTHLGLSIASGIISYICNARRHKRAQGNSCDYGRMIPSGLTRLLTKLFDHTNSGMPRGEHTCWLVETLFRVHDVTRQ